MLNFNGQVLIIREAHLQKHKRLECPLGVLHNIKCYTFSV